MVEIALPLTPYADEVWCDMFRGALVPDGLRAAGLETFDASKEWVSVEVSAAIPDTAIPAVLDWLKATVDAVNVGRVLLAEEHARVEDQVQNWWGQEQPA